MSMSEPTPQLLLASASPRRSALLTQIGVAHRVAAADVDESALPHESPQALVQRLAQSKAQAGVALAQGLPVLGADTIVVLDGVVFGKPRDGAEAQAVLLALGGREHEVYSAVTLLDAQRKAHQNLSRSLVRLRPISVDEAHAYWRSGEPQGKAGGYAIQGLAALFIESLQGSYSGVMGLPLYETSGLLHAAGIVVLPVVHP